MLQHQPVEGAEKALTTPNKIINEHQCRAITTLSRSTRWRMMRRHQFPAKVRLSENRTGWKLSEILEWLSQRESVR